MDITCYTVDISTPAIITTWKLWLSHRPRRAQHLARSAQCHSPLQEDFVFCPYCGAEVLAACPACHRAVRADWTHCAYCGAELLGEKADIPTHSHH